MKKTKRTNGLLNYLEQSGVLQNGTDEQIADAKKTYYRNYRREQKRRQRAGRKDFSIYFRKEDYPEIQRFAHIHGLTLSAFIRRSTLAYITETKLPIKPEQLAELRQVLSLIETEVKNLFENPKQSWWLGERKYEALTAILEKLRKEIDRIFNTHQTSHAD